jgi:hypothetical protein
LPEFDHFGDINEMIAEPLAPRVHASEMSPTGRAASYARGDFTQAESQARWPAGPGAIAGRLRGQECPRSSARDRQECRSSGKHRPPLVGPRPTGMSIPPLPLQDNEGSVDNTQWPVCVPTVAMPGNTMAASHAENPVEPR